MSISKFGEGGEEFNSVGLDHSGSQPFNCAVTEYFILGWPTLVLGPSIGRLKIRVKNKPIED